MPSPASALPREPFPVEPVCDIGEQYRLGTGGPPSLGNPPPVASRAVCTAVRTPGHVVFDTDATNRARLGRPLSLPPQCPPPSSLPHHPHLPVPPYLTIPTCVTLPWRTIPTCQDLPPCRTIPTCVTLPWRTIPTCLPTAPSPPASLCHGPAGRGTGGQNPPCRGLRPSSRTTKHPRTANRPRRTALPRTPRGARARNMRFVLAKATPHRVATALSLATTMLPAGIFRLRAPSRTTTSGAMTTGPAIFGRRSTRVAGGEYPPTSRF